MYVILGLGNPGEKYQKTPHNIGFLLLDHLAPAGKWKLKKNALLQELRFGGVPAILAKPQTFMNMSGQAASQLVSYYKIPVSNLIVVVDDANLNLGAIRIRLMGSDGGHNGLKSIIGYCGPGFPRIRVGIGHCPPEMDLSRYVLKSLSKSQIESVNEIKTLIGKIIETGLSEGWETAASKFNRNG